MRLPLLPPERLSPDQKPLYEGFVKQIDEGFTSFKTKRPDGALLGPWSVWLHEPKIGPALLQYTQAVSTLGRLEDGPKQVAILLVGARFKAAYEIYSHACAGAEKGLSEAKITAISAGQRPFDLEPMEAVAFDVAAALLDGGVLPDPVYNAALKMLGKDKLSELTYLVSLYCMVAVQLNTYDVPGEPRDEGQQL